MKKSTLLLLSIALILLTWCTTQTIINDTTTDQDLTDTTWELILDNNPTSDTQTGIQDNIQIDTQDSTTNLQTWLSDEDLALQQKIQNLVDDRKAASSWENNLTEDDIELMENILTEIAK